MATEYGFFDSVAGDRTIDSADFATVHSSLTIDGYVIGKDDEAQVTQTSPVTDDVQVGLGFVFVQGRWLRIFSAAEIIAVAAASATNPRIDRVAVRVDYSARTATLAYLQGTPAATPVPPTLTQTAGVTWEHPLAQIFLPANATQIYTLQADAGGTQGYVIDERTPAVVGSYGTLGRFTRDADTTKLTINVPNPGAWSRLQLHGRLDHDSTSLSACRMLFNDEDAGQNYMYMRQEWNGSTPATTDGVTNAQTSFIGGLDAGSRHGIFDAFLENVNNPFISGRIELVSRGPLGTTGGFERRQVSLGYENGPIRNITLALQSGPSWSTSSYVDLVASTVP